MAHKIYIISDTHLGHDMLVTNGYRPYGFEAKILRGISNLRLERSDTLYHLGDVSVCAGSGESEWHRRLLSVMWGSAAALIRGNHDKRSLGWYLERGWSAVLDTASLNLYGHRILLSHEPVDIFGLRFTVNIHGHLHDNQHRTDEYPYLNKYNVLYACETYHYQAMPLKSMLKGQLL